MGRNYVVEILVDRLGPGSAPVYESDPDEEWYYLDGDGRTWKTFSGKRCHAPEFELAGPTQQSVVRQVERAIATICLLQEHGGTVVLAIRSFHQVQGPEMAAWELTGSLIITKKSPRELGVVGSERMDGLPAHMVVDDFTMRHLDYMEDVEEVHET
jgi:hypothetical protein